jgi:membrane-bound inhibitor of C-type lysozyme
MSTAVAIVAWHALGGISAMNTGDGPRLVLAIFVLAMAVEVQGCGSVSHTTGTGERARSIIENTFVCSSGERIEALFDTESNRVDLFLSDGRKLDLTQVLSASGARYANPDESIVFWNKGRTAFLQEGGVVTQSDCRGAPHN